jgi:hypothetical protein
VSRSLCSIRSRCCLTQFHFKRCCTRASCSWTASCGFIVLLLASYTLLMTARLVCRLYHSTVTWGTELCTFYRILYRSVMHEMKLIFRLVQRLYHSCSCTTSDRKPS